MNNQTLNIIISGGGTGGHVFPAIAIANSIKAQMPTANLLFVGAKGKLEMDKVPQAGYKIIGLWISGFHRKNMTRNLLFPIKLLVSFIRSFAIILRFRPTAVVGVGGFASGPVLYVASLLKIPTVIQEQNSYAGATNKLLAKKVTKICVAYDNMERYFPREKIVHTGNPVRDVFKSPQKDSAEAYRHFGLDSDKKTVLVFGGSLGAKTLNQALANNTKSIQDNNRNLQVIWQIGKLYWEDFRNCDTAQLANVIVLPFIDRMDLAYEIADVVICRAGALTIAELSITKQAAILVPSPNVAEDHQTKNAMALVDQDAAILVRDEDASHQIIQKAIEIIQNNQLRSKLKKNISQMAKPNADLTIAKTVLELAQNK